MERRRAVEYALERLDSGPSRAERLAPALQCLLAGHLIDVSGGRLTPQPGVTATCSPYGLRCVAPIHGQLPPQGRRRLTVTRIARDASTDDSDVARSTVYDYLVPLERLMVLDPMEAWSPHLRSRARLRTATRGRTASSSPLLRPSAPDRPPDREACSSQLPAAPVGDAGESSVGGRNGRVDRGVEERCGASADGDGVVPVHRHRGVDPAVGFASGGDWPRRSPEPSTSPNSRPRVDSAWTSRPRQPISSASAAVRRMTS